MAGLEFLVLQQNLQNGAVTIVGETGYMAGQRAAAVQAAREASALAQQATAATAQVVVRIVELELADQHREQWVWVSETSYGGASWMNETTAGIAFAGFGKGPEQAEAAASFFLQKRLALLADEIDELDMEDDWWRVSVWRGGRVDETGHAAPGGRLADRANLLATPEKLGWLASVLRSEKIHPDAAATATPVQVNRFITQVAGSRP